MELLDSSAVDSLPRYKNPFIFIDQIKKQDEKLIKWIRFSLTSLKKDKRMRKNVNIKNYFDEFKESWDDTLKDRSINLILNPAVGECKLKAFDIDLDSLFSNLIVNSIEAFKENGSAKERVIEISWKIKERQLIIYYKDSGCGLSEDYKDNPEIIFHSFETSKRDRHGNIIGTGLGMWLVKNIVDDYSGRISILKPEVGFQLEIIFPLSTQKSEISD